LTALPAAPLLALPATLTQAQAKACLAALRQQFPAAGPVLVDASALGRFDSSALAVLLELRREAIAAARPFGVQGMPARLGELAALYGVGELFAPA
jgi:phospholipid transport system transporter-binding protein